MKIVVLGSPGVGKGTYTQDLVLQLQVPHISTGNLFREHIKSGTALGKKAQEYISQGKLVPDELTIQLVQHRFHQADAQQGFILDGFPRTIAQAQALQKITTVDMVLNFTADKEVIMHRLSGRIICRQCGRIYHRLNLIPQKEGECDFCHGDIYQREDDQPKAVEKRLLLYEQQTAPLIEYYKKKGLLRTIKINEEYGKHKEMIQEKIMNVIAMGP